MPKNKITEKNDSLLSEESIKRHIEFAQEVLENQGYLSVQLVFHFHSGEKASVIIEKNLSEPDEKRAAIQALGQQLRARHGGIREVIFISESWITNSSIPDADKIRPSQHPARREAIIVAGRNEDNSCFALATQFFSREGEDELVWHEIVVHQCDEGDGQVFGGILDYLFEEPTDLKSPQMKA